MESSHLIKAHEHARNAATATYGNSIATAGHEHDSAASAFHDAVQDTANSEALRILSLLEDHHRKLAGLIKEPPRKKETTTKQTGQTSEAAAALSPNSKSTTGRTSSPSASNASASSSTRAPSRRRLPQSSIATNLAEKRGIPQRGTPSAGPVSVTNALAGRNEPASTPVRDMLERQSRKAEAEKRGSVDDSGRDNKNKERDTSSAAPTSTEDNFRRFYSAFGGVISAISAPLAFTSLPLSPSPPTPALDPPPKKESKPVSKPTSRNHSPEASRTVKSSEPDLAALISKPALRALQEANTPHFANNESFYLVPTSGGTVSYANILQNPNAPLHHHHHPHHAAQNPHLDSISEADNEAGTGLRGSSHEEFVDARETVGPPSPTASRRPRSQGKAGGTNNSTSNNIATARTLAAGRGAGQKTVEEYELQIETLLQTVDKQSKRIAMWETTSQSSHIALAQSLRARTSLASASSDPSALAHALAMANNNTLHHHPAMPSPPIPPLVSQTATSSALSSPTNPHHPPPSAIQPDAEALKRIADLEARLAAQTAQIADLTADKDQLVRQNEKNALVLGRYREQWEKLKAGARKKQMERTERKGAGASAGASSAAGEAKEGGAAAGVDAKEKVGDSVIDAEGEGDVGDAEREAVEGDAASPPRVPWL